jgi:hypothetical protein
MYEPEPLETRLRLIEEIKRLDNTRCPYVPTKAVRPRFGDLTDEQRRYYAFYKTMFDLDERIKSDAGYDHLLLMECMSTEEGREKLWTYLSVNRNSLFYDRAKPLLNDISLSKGIAATDLAKNKRVGYNMLLTDIFLPEFKGLGWESFQALARAFSIHLWDVGTCDIVSITNYAFTLMEEYLRDKTGKGIGETFARYETSSNFRLFADFLPMEECPYCVAVYHTFDIDRMRPLISDIIVACNTNNSYCARNMYRQTPMVRMRENGIPKEIASSISKFKCIPGTPKDYPDIHNGSVRIEVSRDGSLSNDYPPPVFIQSCNDGEGPSSIANGHGRPLNDAILNDLDDIIGRRSERPWAYTKVILTEEGIQGKEYYLFWRDKFLDGMLYNFNLGCLYVRYMEMVRSGCEPEEILRFVEGTVLDNAYIHPVMESITLEVSSRHDLPVPMSLTASSNLLSCYSLCRVVEGKEQSLSRTFFLELLRLDECGYDQDLDNLWKAFVYTFKVVLKRFREKYSDWEAYGLSFRDRRYPCMFGSCTTEIQYYEYHTLDHIPKAFADEVRELSRNVSRWYREKTENNRTRKKELIVFDVDIVPIMNRAFEMVLGPPKMTKEDISMDSELIQQAQEDLDYVVKAMATEESESEPVAPTEKIEEVAPETDPWASLLDALNDAERKYLEACVDGTKPNVRVEESINSKASETVGDVIIEDGKVFEEYVEKISDMLEKTA